MAKPPYGLIANTAKHGTDENLLAIRDEIRWLARWADDIHGELAMIWNEATVTISPSDDSHSRMRKVDISLTLSEEGVFTLLHLLDEDKP